MQNRIIIIQGRKGSGKTTLARQLIARERRVLVFDVLGEYEARDVAHDARELAELLEAKGSRSFRIVLKVTEDETLHQGCAVAQVAAEHSGPMLIVIEEADLHCSPQSIPHSLDRLIRYGRHWGVSMVAISRRPAEISRHLTAQADTIVAFQTREPRDLEYFRDRCGEEFAREVQRLRRFQYVTWGDPLTKNPRSGTESGGREGGEE